MNRGSLGNFGGKEESCRSELSGGVGEPSVHSECSELSPVYSNKGHFKKRMSVRVFISGVEQKKTIFLPNFYGLWAKINSMNFIS